MLFELNEILFELSKQEVKDILLFLILKAQELFYRLQNTDLKYLYLQASWFHILDSLLFWLSIEIEKKEGKAEFLLFSRICKVEGILVYHAEHWTVAEWV